MDDSVWLAIVGVVLLLALAAYFFKSEEDYWEPKPLLTENEKEFFGRIEKALPDFRIFPQVAFRAIMRPGAKSDYKAYARQSGLIGAKHCDFLICSRKMDVVAIIELDDKTHVAEKDMARDAMTASAGYPTIRYESRDKPSPEQIRADILDLI